VRTRGWGQRRGATVVAIVLAIAVGAPELAAPAGAVTMRSTGRSELQARPATRDELHAKRRRVVRKGGLRPMSAARKRALLVRYIKAHPGVVAAHARRTGVTLAKRLRYAALLRARLKKTKGTALPRVRTPNPAVRPKKKRKKGAASSTWHRTAELLVGSSVGLIALFLIGSSVLNGPRSRARARARRRQRIPATR